MFVVVAHLPVTASLIPSYVNFSSRDSYELRRKLHPKRLSLSTPLSAAVPCYSAPSSGLRCQDMQFSDVIRAFQENVADERIGHVVDLRKNSLDARDYA